MLALLCIRHSLSQTGKELSALLRPHQVLELTRSASIPLHFPATFLALYNLIVNQALVALGDHLLSVECQ